MIQIQNLYKSFRKNKVLKGIELDFSQPGIKAILGPNSSGKTTLIKCLLGMVIPDKGTIFFDQKEIKNQSVYRNKISYLPQIARFPENLKVSELLSMVKDLRQQAARDLDLIKQFDLQSFMNKRLGHLSGGTRQKINLVLAFMYDSPLIILDEPTSGLDPVAMIELKALINREKKAGKIILITSHIMGFVEEIADEIVFLLEGKVYFRGSTKRLLNDYFSNSIEEAIAKMLQIQSKQEMTTN